MKKFLLLCLMSLFILSCTTMRYTTEEIKNFQPQIQEQIKKEEISIGMTFIEVRYAWGAPSQVNVLPPNEQGAERVEWVYKDLFGSSTLRFTNGKITEIISKRGGVAK